jgi:NADPH:quinone reductase-like Zn-dependent oxidoreductase
MVITAHGGPEVFARRDDLPDITPGPNEALVRVKGSSVNPADAGARSGMFGGGPLPAILGYDVSGVIEEIGPGVTEFAPGDAVYYPIPPAHARPGASEPGTERGGGYAEFHVAPVSLMARKPANLSHMEAGAVAGGTAWAALVTRLQIRVGETVLIHGGAGGVGSFAVQIARAAGARVFATCGAYDRERVRALGADRVIDYRSEDFAHILQREAGGADACLVTAGGPVLAQSMAALKRGGRLATVTGPSPGLEQAAFQAAMLGLTLHFVSLDDPRPKLEALGTLLERGLVRPLISHTFPVTQIAEAHRSLETGGPGSYGRSRLPWILTKEAFSPDRVNGFYHACTFYRRHGPHLYRNRTAAFGAGTSGNALQPGQVGEPTARWYDRRGDHRGSQRLRRL